MSRGHSVNKTHIQCNNCKKLYFRLFDTCPWCNEKRTSSIDKEYKTNESAEVDLVSGSKVDCDVDSVIANTLYITDKYGEMITITGKSALVGKGINCELRISDNTLVARIHAGLSYHNGDWYICDLNSTNGTYHNGIKLPATRKYKLSVNDKISFANSEYVILETEDRKQLKKRIYEVRRRVREKTAEIKHCASEKDDKILKIINDLIFDDFCFIKIDIELAFQILSFLGYSKKDAQKLYLELVNSSTSLLHKGRYTLIEPK